MKTYVKSLEKSTWCVDHEGLEVATGAVVGFADPRSAQYFVDAGRAVMLGLFASDAAARTKAGFVAAAPAPPVTPVAPAPSVSSAPRPAPPVSVPETAAAPVSGIATSQPATEAEAPSSPPPAETPRKGRGKGK
jgi:hypothetical protein